MWVGRLHHDLNHSLGEYGDSVNVSKAIADVVELLKFVEPELNGADATFIADLIRATEYPYTGEPKNMYQKIIRDSDLLQWTQPDRERWFDGLSEETGSVVDLGSTKRFLTLTTINTKRTITELFEAGLITRNW